MTSSLAHEHGYELATDLTAAAAPELPDDARQIIDGLRALADTLTASPELVELLGLRWSDFGRHGKINVSVAGQDNARQAIAAFTRAALRSGATVDKSMSDKWGGVVARFGSVGVEVFAEREEVCERVVVGTREVTKEVPDPAALAAMPRVTVTETVEDVEWKCRPLLDAGADQ